MMQTLIHAIVCTQEFYRDFSVDLDTDAAEADSEPFSASEREGGRSASGSKPVAGKSSPALQAPPAVPPSLRLEDALQAFFAAEKRQLECDECKQPNANAEVSFPLPLSFSSSVFCLFPLTYINTVAMKTFLTPPGNCDHCF